jgi:tight adherence protein C
MLLIIGVGAVFMALMTLVLAFSLGSGQTTGVARSLAIIERQLDPHEVAREELPAMERLALPMLGQTRRLAQRLSPSGTTERIHRRLDLAGNPPAWTPERIMGAKGLGLFIGALLGLAIGHLSLRGLGYAAGGGAFMFFLPDILVYNMGLKRQNELRMGLANALDMLTVCVEAGQGFDAALLQVARSAEGPVAGEFARVLSEIQIGKSRGDAFSSLAQRTSVPEVKTFITSLVQADRLGLPIASVLREQSVQMRLIRRQLAEEKAQKVPVKILFPMLFCIFPALMIVVIGPGIMRMMDAFAGKF